MRLRDEGDYLRDGDASGVGVNQAALFQRALRFWARGSKMDPG